MGNEEVDAKQVAAATVNAEMKKSIGTDYVLSTLRYWDVTMSPTKQYMLGGYMMPSVKSAATSLFMKKRRITVEIYKAASPDVEVADYNRKQTKKIFSDLLKGVTSTSLMDCSQIESGDMISFRILKPAVVNKTDKEVNADGGDWETGSASNFSVSSVESENESSIDFESSNILWSERFRCRLDSLEMLTRDGKSCDIQMGVGVDKVIKTIDFETNHDFQSFLRLLNQMNDIQSNLGAQLASAYADEKKMDSPQRKKTSSTFFRSMLGKATPGTELEDDIEVGDEDTTIKILVEIVSATNLPIGDIVSSDPYVKVFDGSNELHRTEVLPKTLNPVWTISNGSLFLIKMPINQYFSKINFLSFEVKDYDAIGSNDVIGSVQISKEHIARGAGERTEFELIPPPKYALTKKDREGKSLLTLRFKPASDEDVAFMEAFALNRKSKRAAAYSDETFLPPRDHKVSMMKKKERKVHHRQIEYRVKPFADPERKSETTWLTEKEIDFESQQSSKHWIEAGTGSLGKVFVEVLGCSNLPNLDASITGRDKTDAFTCLVFEDCIVNTDVINDSLSPRWMPWSQRAFIFNIMHPSSQLMLGVFDYDGTFGNPDHDAVGRAVINISNLRPDTIYNTEYTLYERSSDGRVARGTITLRLRVEMESRRKMILGGAKPVFNFDVSVAKKQHFKTVHHTITHGEHPSVLSLSILTGYLKELQSYLDILFYLPPAVATVLFWRGHFPLNFRVPFCGKTTANKKQSMMERWTRKATIMLPLHSVISFSWGITLANDFDRFPSFIVFAVAWFFLATLEVSRNHPSRYLHPPGYLELLGMIILDRPASSVSISSGENVEEIHTYHRRREEMKRAREKVVQTVRMEQKKYQAYIEEEMAHQENDVDVTTKMDAGIESLPLAPFAGVLLPLQHVLHGVCVILRVLTSIVTWRDGYVSFWLTTICLAASLILFWIPWSFLIGWAFKILVWTFLGPWMKLVDILVLRKRTVEEEKEAKRNLAKRFQGRYAAILGESLQRKVRKESALKLKEIKKYMFGQYLMRVPVYKEERYRDDPLPSSYAKPFDPSEFGDINIVDRKFGQILKGDMIPERELRLVAQDDSNPTNGIGGGSFSTPLSKGAESTGRPSKYQLTLPDRALQATEEETYPLLPTYSEDIYGAVDEFDQPRKVSVAAGGNGVEVIDEFV